MHRSVHSAALQPRWVNTIRRRLWWNTFSGRLFWTVILGTMTGMGGMAFLFSDMLKRQTENQVRQSVNSKVHAISSITQSAETLAYSLGISAVTLNERQAQYADTYRELVQRLFEKRPEFVTGLGLGQAKNGIIPNQSWLFPYYSVVTPEIETTSANEGVQYENLADSTGEFYPESERYKQYFLPQQKLWSDPYYQADSRQLTYYYPLFNQEGRWLGTTLVDINTDYLNNVLSDQVFQQSGRFLLLTRTGLLIADPNNPFTKVNNYKDIAGINNIWDQINKESSGFIHGENGYWAYSQVPEKDWILLGYVPYKAVFGRIVKITALITCLVGLFTITITYCALRALSQRLKPILLQANEFASNDQQLRVSIHQDELDQVSLSFFNILNQLNLFQIEIDHREAVIAQSNQYITQTIEKFLAFTTEIDDNISGQQQLFAHAKQQLASQKNIYSIINRQFCVLCALTQTLEKDLDNLPPGQQISQLLEAMEHHILTLTTSVDNSPSADTVRYQEVMTQLMGDIDRLKTYHHYADVLSMQQYPVDDSSLKPESIEEETETITTINQSIGQTLSKIEFTHQRLTQEIQEISNTLWGDLQQANPIPIYSPHQNHLKSSIDPIPSAQIFTNSKDLSQSKTQP